MSLSSDWGNGRPAPVVTYLGIPVPSKGFNADGGKGGMPRAPNNLTSSHLRVGTENREVSAPV